MCIRDSKYTLERTVDPKLSIDFTPRNKDISCKADSNVKKGSKFGAKKEEPVPEEPVVGALVATNGGATGSEDMSHLLSLIHISEPTRLLSISYAVFCLKKNIPSPPASLLLFSYTHI
eukprot:TRINITY_DN35361_c0_g1_i1.p1 TRINITY_DN35361_c0_g1~~TRINITY_DN35361_c0_g1_i1.p1  ORF type:complete len:118 (+),score=48.89 TRINITY_DN35361_c0_g1_i1:125-478(+)